MARARDMAPIVDNVYHQYLFGLHEEAIVVNVFTNLLYTPLSSCEN